MSITEHDSPSYGSTLFTVYTVSPYSATNEEMATLIPFGWRVVLCCVHKTLFTLHTVVLEVVLSLLCEGERVWLV